MDDAFSYPVDTMEIAASNVRGEVETIVPQHAQIIAAMTNLEGLFPGNVEATFAEHVRSWSHNVQACYDGLQALAGNLSQGSQKMAEIDQNVSRGFGRG